MNLNVIQRCCDPVLDSPLDEASAEALATSFRVLADPVRLRLLSLIAADDEVCACDLVDAVDRSQPTVSHHLKVLREAGLLRSEKRGAWVFYSAVPERLAVLRDALGASTR